MWTESSVCFCVLAVSLFYLFFYLFLLGVINGSACIPPPFGFFQGASCLNKGFTRNFLSGSTPPTPFLVLSPSA